MVWRQANEAESALKRDGDPQRLFQEGFDQAGTRGVFNSNCPIATESAPHRMPRPYSSGRDILFESSARGDEGMIQRQSHHPKPPNAGLHGISGYFIRGVEEGSI